MQELDHSATDTSTGLATKTRELLNKKGIKSPDVSKMLAFKANNRTTYYASTPEKLECLKLKHSQQ